MTVVTKMGLKPLIGVTLVLIYTGFISSADAITKFLAGTYAPAQVYVLSGAIVASLAALTTGVLRRRPGAAPVSLRTSCPRAMALRSAATVLATLCFFYAFKHLMFADVFLFIGLMPVIAALMSGPILKEPVRRSTWFALGAGALGVLILVPNGLHGDYLAHAVAFAAAVFGTFSMTMARYIGRYESNSLAQVFYPNLTICATMAMVLPFVWLPMALADVEWIAAYAVFLFGARWVLVVALRVLSAYVVTPLMNLQFVWMAVIGVVAFGEHPQLSTYIGVGTVIASGLYLAADQVILSVSRKVADPITPVGGLRTEP